MSAPAPASVRTAIEITGLSLLLVLVLRFAWIGFLASDDWSYLNAAQSWVEQSPHVGDNHWALRHTLVLPLALVVRGFGVTEFNVTLPTLSYFCAVLAFTYWVVRQLFGRTSAVVTTGLLILTPLFAEYATIASVDIVEMFFVLLSLWLFYRATLGGSAQCLLIVAGVAAGFAWLSRETTIGLLTFYGLLFLLGKYFPRRRYWLIAAGMLAVVATESLYFYTIVGDPFHRVRVVYTIYGPSGVEPMFGTGNITDHPVIGPVLALLINNEFGLLYFLAVVAATGTCFGGDLPREGRRFVRLVAGLGFVWFLTLAYGTTLLPLPRYYSVTTLAAVVLTGIWITVVLSRRSRWAAGLLLATLVSTNLLCIYVTNRDPRFGERTLANFVADSTGIVYTDPATAHLARKFLEWREEGLVDRVRGAPPPAGSLYFYHPTRALSGIVGGETFDIERYRPASEWREVWCASPGRTIIGDIVATLTLDRFLPETIGRKLLAKNRDVVVYRTTESR